MNEEQKNIETCLAENILDEVANVPTDAQFRSLVEESFDPLQQQALQQAGYDGYKKVVWTHKPYTFTSKVKQMKSNLILLLRRLWRYPFGRGTTASAAGSSAASAAAPIRSLADMWQHYITRLKGNAEYGIPSRLSSLTDLPSAPALLSDRKISGVPEAPDGISLVQLCLDKIVAAEIETVIDGTTGWTMNRSFNNLFQNAKKVTLGCKYIRTDQVSLFNNLSNLEELEFTNCELISGSNWSYGTGNINIIGNNNALKKFKTPSLKELRSLTQWSQCPLLSNNPLLEEWYSPMFEKTNCSHIVYNCPKLRKVVFGKMIKDFVSAYNTYENNFNGSSTNLVHFEIGAGTEVSLHLNWWKSTIALRTDTDAEDYVDLREDMSLANNLQQFLSNFKTYIAERLTDKGSGLTLTLSQAVRDAIQQDPEIVSIITGKGWTISPAPSV